VSETIEYEQFDHPAGRGQDGGGHATIDAATDADLSRLSDIPMELSVEIGRTHMTVGETLDLRIGSVVTLERLAGETADLLVNGSAIARGEVVVIDEQYGLRITEILDAADAASSPRGEPHIHTPPADGTPGGGAPTGGDGEPAAASAPGASAGSAPGAAAARGASGVASVAGTPAGESAGAGDAPGAGEGADA
jgi:flagellar motor switch protein FliN